MNSLTIFYPAYNEEGFIRRAVEAAEEVGNRMVKDKELTDYEVLIVNDGSTDGTADLADEMAAGNARLRVIHHDVNKGLGGSLKTGFSSARMDVILYSDIDLPFDMMELRRAYRLMRYYQADIVSAFRFDRTGEGLRRLIYSTVYNTLIHALFRLRVKDINFAFKLVRKEVFEHVSLKSGGSFIDAELLAKANRCGFKIIQFGTNYFPRHRGVSTLSTSRVIIRILKEMSLLYREIKSIRPIGNE
ncbi:MAG: glycosyltransferase family 2 protein [Fidelibacterota bacterium]|nr:MAG: glycosyltransferase family 2 protein [Candidatus Neomarinimicrobiota bacterium]